MITAATLKTYTVKHLAQMAKQVGVPGWHAMRKDELVKALSRDARSKASKSKKKQPAAKSRSKAAVDPGKPKVKSPHVLRQIQKAHAERERQKDLATTSYGADPAPANGQRGANGNGASNGDSVKQRAKDRVVLMVRDSYWLQAHWELTRQSVQRAQAAMAENWHTARPNLRVVQLDRGHTTNVSERVVRDIEIHGGVKNWYVDVPSPPQTYRVDIGYLAGNGRFYPLARSNAVTTPRPGAGEAVAESWSDSVEDYERIYALSGGYAQGDTHELQELFEERLRRPMGQPVTCQLGSSVDRMLGRERDFTFCVDAELVISGSTKPDARLTMAGEPVKVQPDGSFSVKLSMPERRQVIPVVAQSGDGVEQRTIVLAVERNTKVMETVIREGDE